MSKRIKNFLGILNSPKLKPADKIFIKQELITFMNANPVRIENPGRHIFYTLTHKHMFAGALVGIILAVSGGVSYAAQGALPGDILYPIKVNINEEIRASLTFDKEAKAEYEAQRYGRRISEAIILADQGALDAEHKAGLEVKLAEHKAKVEELSIDLESKGNLTAATNVQSSLAARVHAYNQAIKHFSASSTISDLEDDVPEPSVTSGGQSQNFVLELMTKTKDWITKVNDQLVNHTDLGAESKVYVYVTTRLKSAEKLVIAAEAEYQAQNYVSAYALTQKARSLIQEAQAMLDLNQSTSVNFDLDLQEDENEDDQSEIKTEIDKDIKGDNDKRDKKEDKKDERNSLESRTRVDINTSLTK